MASCGCIRCNNFGSNTDCLSATDLQVGNITNISVDLMWVNNSQISTGISVEYKDPSSSTWTILPTLASTINNITLTGLTPNTDYDIRINTICGEELPCMSLTIKIKTLE
jgi:hypothetical protein